jgi:hypothetical protein
MSRVRIEGRKVSLVLQRILLLLAMDLIRLLDARLFAQIHRQKPRRAEARMKGRKKKKRVVVRVYGQSSL